MEIKTVDLSWFKSKFKVFFSMASAAVVISFVLVYLDFVIIDNKSLAEYLADILIIVVVVIAIMSSFWQQKQRRRLMEFSEFNDRLDHYRKIFMSRLWWHVISAATSGFLYVLTGRQIFLWFGLFDVLVTCIAYPNKRVMSRELMEPDIEFLD